MRRPFLSEVVLLICIVIIVLLTLFIADNLLDSDGSHIAPEPAREESR